EFINANTDAQALRKTQTRSQLQLGSHLTKGLGAGTNPEVGRQAALEDRERIMDMLNGADMVFVTAGMGGGTGTGAAPVVAEIAKEMGILTVGVVTKPFAFEGRKKGVTAEQGIQQLSQHVDSLIVIPNEKLMMVLGPDTSLLDAFKAANDVLLGAVQGISELITRPGHINLDFADVRTVMSEMGHAMMGTGTARGVGRAREAAEAAIKSPLLDDINLHGARGVLVNITAGENLSLGEFTEVGNIIEEFAADTAHIKIGTAVDPALGDELRVTVVVTGLGKGQEKAKPELSVVGNAREAYPQRGDLYQNRDSGRSASPYRNDDLGSYAPRRSSQHQNSASSVGQGTRQMPPADAEMDYLDIPAFLRRQAD
ncbi:MAG TPA: cell division protein FtsZ, partial [Pseudomonadales bacterium]|nr:cell division protein FtsZ [Pseudomonadales bacterium]